MDLLTHIVVGRAVVAAADHGGRPARGVAAAAILGALSPDIDAAVAFSGWDRYVRIHEIATHSIVGAVLMACFTAVVVRAVVRFRRGEARFVELLGAATAGALSHIILDLACGGRIRLGWPLVQDRVTLPLVAMADPWLIGICVLGIAAVWPGRRPMRAVARALVGAAIVFLGFKAGLLERALRVSHVGPVSPLAVRAHWGSLTEWSVFERTAGSVRAWTVKSGGEPATVSMSRQIGPDTPLVHASRSLDTVRNFLSAHDFSFPVEQPTHDGRTEVLWSDLRYCWPTFARAQPERASAGQAPSFARLEQEGASAWHVRTPVGDDSIACGVWAGGVFDADGRPITQVVKIGAVVQTRQAPR